MDRMTVTTANLASTAERRAQIEKRIQVDMACAYEKVVDIGRCLNEAKEGGLIPHGHWTEWVESVCGMTERQAQRWMQIAREVPEGSYLSRLDVSKIREVLTLPEAQREDVAKAALEDNLTLRQLQGEIQQLRQRARTAEVNCSNLKDYGERKDARIKELEERLEEARKATAANGISAEAAKQIENLKRELADAEEFGNVQSEKRREAQMELARMKENREAAREARAFGSEDLMTAVRQFIGVTGAVPHMGAEFAAMNTKQLRAFEQALAIIDEWSAGAHRALNTVGGEISE